VAESFYTLGGELLCIDEIHKYSDWSLELKSIYDTFPKLKVIASGSSALAVYQGSHDLSRRALRYYLPGLSFREYLEMTRQIAFAGFKLKDIVEDHQKIAHDIINAAENNKLKILPIFKEYLRIGFYPYSMRYKDQEDRFNITLEQHLHTTLENDLLSIHPSLSGVSIKKIKQLLSYLISHTPYQVALSKLRRALGISHERTLKTYLKYLEDAQVINVLCYEGKSLASFDKPEKIYLNNTNQLYALGEGQTDIRNLRETFFMNAVSQKYSVTYSGRGDFNLEGLIFEVGEKNKGYEQIKDIKSSYLAVDDTEKGIGNKIPLWMFGFLY
jgi:predicted AAA+ superfamily ATPase